VLLFLKKVILGMCGWAITNNVRERFHLKPFDLALTAIMAATNFVICATVAPALKVVIPQVFLGAFVMVPLDLFFAYTTWAITRKNIFILYFLIFGLLTVPTTIWGNTPGIFKPFLGLAIGLLLDLLIIRLKLKLWLLTPQQKHTRAIAGLADNTTETPN
jgi:hypothetical protein